MKVTSLYDTLFVQQFVSKHARRPPWELPAAYHLATQPHLAGEREYIDALLQKAPPKIREAWVAGLLSSSDRCHIPLWFEIMLFGWLMDIGKVRPLVPGPKESPDFALRIKDQEIAVEALCHLVPEKERSLTRRFNHLVAVIHSVQRPFLLRILDAKLPAPLRPQHLIENITKWLDTAPSKTHTYRDGSETHIVLAAQPLSHSHGHAVFVHAGTFKSDGAPLKKPLRRKADKYRHVRRRKPFLIALFLESPEYSDYDVSIALFGRTNIIIDRQAERVVGAEVDRTGILYWGNTILHRSVSGVLAFSWRHDQGLKRRVLQASFLENPYARRPVPHYAIPCRRRFVVTAHAPTHMQMQWLPDEPE